MRIAKTVSSCVECHHRHYESAGRYGCGAVGYAPLIEEAKIPKWCPLPEHPGAIAAQALSDLHIVKNVLETARREAAGASPERLRDLISIAADQISNV